MKNNLMKTIVAILALIIISNYAEARKKEFKGYIKYVISYEDSNMTDETKAFLPTEMIQYISGSNTRIEIDIIVGKQIIITNGDEKFMAILMDMAGQKIAMKMTEEQINEELRKTAKPEIKKFNETKKIIGYKCKKAEIIDFDEDNNKSVSTIYYTDEITTGDINWANEYGDLEGIRMEYSEKKGTQTMFFSAKEIKKADLEPELFTIPADYTIMTNEEIQQMYGEE